MAPIFKYGEVYYGADDATAAYLGTDIIFPLFKIRYAIDTEAVTAGNVDWTLRQDGGGTFNVDWGDGSSQTNQTSDALAHTYSSAGKYNVIVTALGPYSPFFDNESPDDQQILAVSFPDSDAGSFAGVSSAWHGASNMVSFGETAAFSNSTVISFNST